MSGDTVSQRDQAQAASAPEVPAGQLEPLLTRLTSTPAAEWQERCADELSKLRELSDAGVLITALKSEDKPAMVMYCGLQEELDRLFSEAPPGPSETKHMQGDPVLVVVVVPLGAAPPATLLPSIANYPPAGSPFVLPPPLHGQPHMRLFPAGATAAADHFTGWLQAENPGLRVLRTATSAAVTLS